MRISDWSSDVCSSDLAAQAHSFFSHLDTNIQRILAGFGTLRDLVTDVRASLADAAARDAQRAEDEEARDTAIAARLVDPAVLAARAEAGARHGAAEIGRAHV